MHHSDTHCLNCSTELKGAYCFKCGQKASTHRFSVGHFVAHEMVHGIWHLDKGIVFTLNHIFTRPGKLVREYIAGKRMGHFSLVTLLIMLASMLLFVLSHRFTAPLDLKINGEPAPGFVQFLGKVSKWAVLIMVPIMAKASKDLFKMLRFNYTEHLVMNGFFYAGSLCIALAFSALYYIPGISASYVTIAEIVAILIYLTIAYRQATKDLYVPGIFARVVFLFYLSICGYFMFVVSATVALYQLADKLF